MNPLSEEALEETVLGGTPAGRAANAALRALSKAARACTLYDAQNEAIRRFLHDYRDAMTAALSGHGALALEVRSFELTLHGEVVHTEKDRERSLAYRLFRDGVRKLEIEPGVPWDELRRLLEVLSVRFIGVRQQEEDVVTLLTRAAFGSIHFTAVAGLVARDQDEDGDVLATDGERSTRREAAPEFPPDWDGPVPTVLAPRAFGYYALPAFLCDGFEAEESPSELPGHAVRMIRELLDGASPAELSALVPAVAEVRDFLVSELKLAQLCDFARVVAGEHGAAARTLGPVLLPLAAGATLQKLLATIPPGGPASDDLVELLDVLGGAGADLLDPLLDRLAASFASGTKTVDPALHALAVRAARNRADHLLGRLATAEPALVPVLLGLLRATVPRRLTDVADVLLARPEEALGLEALALLRQAGPREEVSLTLLALLESPRPALRIGAAELLAHHLERRAFPAIVQLVLAREPKGLDEAEADAMGEALAAISPREAATLFASWVRLERKGMFARFTAPRPKRMLAWTAAAGLTQVLGEDALAMLKEIGAHADEDLRRRCAKSTALWRRGVGRHG